MVVGSIDLIMYLNDCLYRYLNEVLESGRAGFISRVSVTLARNTD